MPRLVASLVVPLLCVYLMLQEWTGSFAGPAEHVLGAFLNSCVTMDKSMPFLLDNSSDEQKFKKRRCQVLKQQNYDHSMLGEARGSAAVKVDSNRSH